MLPSSFFETLDASLSGLVPAHRVECHGAWSTRPRKTYASASQQVPGVGPYVEVFDARWNGALTSEIGLCAMLFLATAGGIFWVKAPWFATTLGVEITLRAHANYLPHRAELSASVARANLQGGSIAAKGRLEDLCTLGPQVLTTGRVTCLAATSEAEFFALVLPRAVVKVGRTRLWRLRENLAGQLPSTVRELLTRRRAGTISPGREEAE